MHKVFLLVVIVAVVPSVFASEPGQPFDCNDWIINDPALTCSVSIPYPCPSPGACAGHSIAVDNGGSILYRYYSPDDQIGLCGCTNPGQCGVNRVRLYRWSNDAEEVIAEINGRCVDPTIMQRQTPEPSGMLFDAHNGRLLVSIYFETAGSGLGTMQFAFEGFATTFEILQTYTPSASTIGFRVPAMPEGFQYADYFDTYYGDLDTVGDWSQARPLQCGYPATSPSVGDYLAVDDTLPSPAPGDGYYYVTAVNYMGQRRYGRKSMGGVLSGRDPAVLPGCH